MSVWLLDFQELEGLRVLRYFELLGMKLALQDLLRKYGDLLPEEARKAVQIALNDVDTELWELEGDLAHVLPDRKAARQRTGEAVHVNA
ncbi:MAG: hypothetical protein F7B18_02420 [Desulfurococcales archaeon]|nr:hypothetical protein [Desulfurococcales archaeon]